MNKSPFQIARERTPSRTVKTRSKSAEVAKTQELAERPTTVFDTNHSGHNTLDTLNNCPVCGKVMTPTIIDTLDGRQLPVNYCLTHRTCLPTGVANEQS